MLDSVLIANRGDPSRLRLPVGKPGFRRGAGAMRASSSSARQRQAIRAMGLKDAAKALMEKAGVPVVPGYHGDNAGPGLPQAKADEIGYPVLIKARAGGGGKGMRRVDNPKDFEGGAEGRAARGARPASATTAF
jgi:pyruvate carboxylase